MLLETRLTTAFPPKPIVSFSLKTGNIKSKERREQHRVQEVKKKKKNPGVFNLKITSSEELGYGYLHMKLPGNLLS